MKLIKTLIKYKVLILRLMYTIGFVFMLFSCSTIAQLFSRPDTLNSYEFSDFYNLDTSLKTKYPFIHFEKNNFQFLTPVSPNWVNLYRNMQKMVQEKDRKLNFYHIGGSHLQADIYTHDIREKLQMTWEGVPGERGFLFPFDLAKTNNPANYEFSSSNNWKSYRSVAHDVCELDYVKKMK